MCVRGIDVAYFYDIFFDFGAVPIVCLFPLYSDAMVVFFSLFYQDLYLNSKPISSQSDLILFSYMNYIFCCVKKYTTFRVNACSKKIK